MLNIFKKGHRTLTTDIDAWVVRWNKAYGSSRYPDFKETAQFFTSKEEAKDFVEALKKSIKLLGHSCGSLTWVECKKVVNSGVEE